MMSFGRIRFLAGLIAVLAPAAVRAQTQPTETTPPGNTAAPAPAETPAPPPPPAEAPAPPPLPAATPPPGPPDPAALGGVPAVTGGAIRGRVFLAGTDTPLAQIEVVIRAPDGSTISTLAGDDGAFFVAGLAPGRHRVEFAATGFAALSEEVDVVDGEVQVDLAISAGETIVVTDTWRGEAQEMRESAEAVQVVETDEAARENADLGEVLARVQGVGVRRSGGLGSAARFSLAGLTDDQIRFFLDGLPLELVGFSQGIANVPVNMVERIEVYRGVVPARFGADALGGAVNLATEQIWHGTQASASYQVGSFGTHRTTVAARHRYDSGFVTSANAFFDDTANDYQVDVEVADDRGRLMPARVSRQHDHYRAYGAHVELGVIDRPWARRLTLLGFVTRYDKDIPHNAVMTVPYGEARYGGTSLGAALRWDQPDVGGSGIDVEAVAAYGWRAVDFVDNSAWVYDWYGQRIRERPVAGEIDTQPSDQTVWTHEVTGRVHLARSLGPHQELRATLAPNFITRTGKERLLSNAAIRDPLSAQRDLLSGFVGIEHELDALGDRFENIVLAKNYLLWAATEETLPGGLFRDLDRTLQRFGVGDSLRWRFTPWLWGKASYEWTTRQPRADELFGDGVLIGANLKLGQETSHNGNLGLALAASSPSAGTWTGELTAFARIADDFIVLLGNDRYYTYQNVYAARSLGGDLLLGWTAPGEWLSLDVTGTYIDLRNASSDGTFGKFEGDRIPSRPWLQAAAGVTLHHRGLVRDNDSITASLNSRYVHEFFRGWESQGALEFKQVVPAQLVHGAVVTYLVDEGADFSLSVEVANLTDERVFDFFGVQRPGRAFSLKATAAY